jgi:dynein intermediate chain
VSAGELSNENSDSAAQSNRHSQPLSISTQILSTIPLATVYEFQPSPVKEVFSYSKAVQTTEEWTQTSRPRAFSESEEEDTDRPVTPTPGKRTSRRERDREEELRQNIRKELEEWMAH